MIKSLAIVLMALALVACGTKAVQPTLIPAGTVSVKVPVSTCGPGLSTAIQRSMLLRRPAVLPIQLLTTVDAEDYNKVQTAYAETVAILIEYATALETDRGEIHQHCEAAKEQLKTLNTVQPNTLSVPK